jgi:hypothetical protein
MYRTLTVNHNEYDHYSLVKNPITVEKVIARKTIARKKNVARKRSSAKDRFIMIRCLLMVADIWYVCIDSALACALLFTRNSTLMILVFVNSKCDDILVFSRCLWGGMLWDGTYRPNNLYLYFPLSLSI